MNAAIVAMWGFLGAVVLTAFALHGCNVPPQAPSTVDASDCGAANVINQGRLIRDPDSGLAAVLPCP